MNLPRIVFAGGGTGGHIAPGLALAERYAARYGSESVLFLSGGNDLERRMIGGAGFQLEAVPVRRPRGRTGRLLSAASLLRAIPAARKAIRRFGACGVVGLGGYASVPGVAAAKLSGLPVVLLEANVVPGRVTRLLSRWAALCCAGFPVSSRLHCPAAVCGTPLREAFLRKLDRGEARSRLGLDPALPTLLVVGGSQGASALNRAVFAAAPALREQADRLQILHITGAADIEAARRIWSDSGLRYAAAAFTPDMPIWIAAADLALSRAGASTLSELLALGTPVVAVPFPFSADDHQRANACFVAAAGAGSVIPEHALDHDRILEIVHRCLLDATALARLSRAALALGRPDAAEAVLQRTAPIFGFSLSTPAAEESQRAAA